jgi:serine/threonine-protein kinase RsbW
MLPREVSVEICIPNQLSYLSLVGNLAEVLARNLQQYEKDGEELAYHLNLALTEALANAIVHANAGDPAKKVRVIIEISDQALHVKVFDQGQGFDINAVPPPDPQQLQDSGRGIFVIKALMDSVAYTRTPDGNVLEMIKYLKQKKAAKA